MKWKNVRGVAITSEPQLVENNFKVIKKMILNRGRSGKCQGRIPGKGKRQLNREHSVGTVVGSLPPSVHFMVHEEGINKSGTYPSSRFKACTRT